MPVEIRALETVYKGYVTLMKATLDAGDGAGVAVVLDLADERVAIPSVQGGLHQGDIALVDRLQRADLHRHRASFPARLQ